MLISELLHTGETLIKREHDQHGFRPLPSSRPTCPARAMYVGMRHSLRRCLEVETIEAVALFDYTGRTDKELSFKKNQTIYIFKKMNHEWWQGYLAGGIESGFVPDGYIKLKARYVRTSHRVPSTISDGSFTIEMKVNESFVFRRRDSAPIPNQLPLSITPDPASSLNSINLTAASSSEQFDAPIVYRPPSDLSLVDELRLKTAKETEIVAVDSDAEDDDDDDDDVDSDDSQDNTYENTSTASRAKSTHRSIYDVLPPSPPAPQTANDHCHSQSSTSSSSRLTSTNEQQIIDIDTALREVLSGIRTVEECHAQCFRSMPLANSQPESDAPDLVLNLPISSGLITPPASKSIDNNINEAPSPKSSASSSSSSKGSPVHYLPDTNNNHTSALVQSAIINDSARTSRSNSSSAPAVHFIEKIRPSPEPNNRKKIPPPIMKKPEKTVELLKRLGLHPPADAPCGATTASASHAHPPAIPAAGSSKTTDV